MTEDNKEKLTLKVLQGRIEILKDLVTISGPPSGAKHLTLAFESLCQKMRDNPKLKRDMLQWARTIQHGRLGVLTDFIEALTSTTDG